MLKAYIYKGVFSYNGRLDDPPLSTTTIDEFKKNPILIIDLEDFEVSDKLDELYQFDLKFNLNNFDLDYFPLEKYKNYYAEVFYGNTLIASGLLYEFDIDLVTGDTTISCNNPLFMLNYIPAIPNAIMNNRSTIGHVAGLLDWTRNAKQDNASNRSEMWEYQPIKIGRFATLDDWDVLTSVDLRGEKQLYSQLQKILKTTKNLFVKYSRPNITIYFNVFIAMWDSIFHHLIDIGNFSYDVNFQLDNSNIKSMSIRKELQPKATWVNGYGGEYTLAGVKKQLRISDKQMFFKELPDITHSSVVGDSSYVQLTDYVSEIDDVSGLTEYFTDIQPNPVDDPNATEIRRAAQSLYLKSARQIRAKEKQDEISIETDDFPINLEAGNKVNFQYEYTKEYYNPINNTLERKVLEELSYPNQSYYVREITKSFKGTGERSAKITLHPRPEYHEVESEAKEVALARKLKADGEIFVIPEPKITLGYYEFTVSGVAANSTNVYGNCYEKTISKLGDIQLGDQTTTPISTTPVNWFTADSVSISKNAQLSVGAYGLREIHDDVYRIQFHDTLYPSQDLSAFGLTNGVNFKIRVQKNNDWTINDSITVKVLVFFEL